MKIDMVYLWCDGNDPEFIRRKNEYISDEDKKIVKVSGDVRFWDNEELRYSLRSLEKYAPWINHVYIITDRQIPYWLNTDYDKVTIIDHSQIMPPKCIPCFNSNVIEYFLPFVPNLSEIFLYSNDDMFFCAPVTPEDFVENNKPLMRLIKPHMELNSIKKKLRSILGRMGVKKYKDNVDTVVNAWDLVKKEHGRIDKLVIHHNIDVYSKSAYLATLAKFEPLFNQTNQYRFRNPHCIHRIIFALDAVYSGKATYKIVKGFDGLSKAFVGLQRQKVFSYMGKEYHTDKIKKVIKNNAPKLFCMNASDKATKEMKIAAKKFMEELFPEPSKFEKQ